MAAPWDRTSFWSDKRVLGPDTGGAAPDQDALKPLDRALQKGLSGHFRVVCISP